MTSLLTPERRALRATPEHCAAPHGDGWEDEIDHPRSAGSPARRPMP